MPITQKNPTQFQNDLDRWMPPEQFGQYQLESEIDSGGMGIIYKGYTLPDHNAVAIKFMIDKSQYRRFQREAATGLRLHHRNFVRFHDTGDVDGHFYIVMDFINGEPLKRYMERVNLTPDQRLSLFYKIAVAIAYAHGQGVIHRDLKPGNILVDTENEPVILDFGLAKRMDLPDQDQTALTIAGQILGTPGYMSPEQARGEIDNQDERSDIFCLGIILYEMLTARNPFEGSNFLEICYNIAHKTPTPIDQVIPGIPPQLAHICTQALASQKEDRYQTADALAKDLKDYLSSRKKGNEQVTIAATALTEVLPAQTNELLKPLSPQRKLSKILCTSCGALNDPGTTHCQKCNAAMRKSGLVKAMNSNSNTPAPSPQANAGYLASPATPAKIFIKKTVSQKLPLAMPTELPNNMLSNMPTAKEYQQRNETAPGLSAKTSPKALSFHKTAVLLGSSLMVIAMLPLVQQQQLPLYTLLLDAVAGGVGAAILLKKNGGALLGCMLFVAVGMVALFGKYLLMAAPHPLQNKYLPQIVMGISLWLSLGCTMGFASQLFGRPPEGSFEYENHP